MSEHVLNSETALQSFIGDLREQWRVRRFLTVKVRAGKDRSLNQNAISHAWYAQVARELREDDERGVKRFCKLHFGVPILRAEDADFRAAYDGAIRSTLTYEQKLVAMDMLTVTSIMSTLQLHQYMLDMQGHYYGRVALEFPDDYAAPKARAA
jgi:hypothetical protein